MAKFLNSLLDKPAISFLSGSDLLACTSSFCEAPHALEDEMMDSSLVSMAGMGEEIKPYKIHVGSSRVQEPRAIIYVYSRDLCHLHSPSMVLEKANVP